jgi:exopolyphosphatase / guanosine-5'-triphosphate,3'-diphosphate pyrophosphatase
VAAPVRSLLTDEEIDTAEAVGKALRLAHNLSGSAPGLLPGTRFKIKDDVITLVLLDKDDDGRDIFISEAIERRLSQLAKSLNKTARFD